jgi:hypothetical protein
VKQIAREDPDPKFTAENAKDANRVVSNFEIRNSDFLTEGRPMARSQKVEAPREAATKVLEGGDIFFAYRPKVDKQVAKSIDDVQRLYMILHPRGKHTYRLMIIGEKRLPSVNGGGDRKTWGFVAKVAQDPEEVEDELDPERYETKTRGEREVPAARPAGEGIYAIAAHEGHTHLAYVLELPKKPGEVQRALNIVDQGSYIIAVKNPEAPSAPGTGLDETRRARFAKKLQQRFAGRRFIPADPPDFLDYEWAEIILVGARKDVYAELGLELAPENETEATAEIFTDLKMERSVHPLKPLFEGKWE